MIPVSSAAVSREMARWMTRRSDLTRAPLRATVRTTRGSSSSPPFAIAANAAAICSGVTATWYPIAMEAIARSLSVSALQTRPWLSAGKSRDRACPKPNRSTYRLSRSGPRRSPTRMAPTLLDLTITSVKVRGP